MSCARSIHGPIADGPVLGEYVAAEFGARVTLAGVTATVQSWGPGGTHVNRRWSRELRADASQHIAGLQKNMAIKADVFIGSGDVPTVLSQAAKQTKADLLVTGCRGYGENLRTRGYSIMRSVPIPVLSVEGVTRCGTQHECKKLSKLPDTIRAAAEKFAIATSPTWTSPAPNHSS